MMMFIFVSFEGKPTKAVGGQVLQTGQSRRAYSRQAAILLAPHPAIDELMDVKKPQLSGAESALSLGV
jgi:hypothetical protein